MRVNAHLPHAHRRRSVPPIGRAPGQYTRALVLRMRMRALLMIGLFAVFTVVVGRLVGFHHVVFEASEIALLCVCFGVTRYVLPVVERYDRGAQGEEYVGAILEELRSDGWLVIHDAELQQQQRRPHRPGAGRAVHDRDEEQPRPDQRAASARAADPPGPAAARARRGARGRQRRAAARLQSRPRRSTRAPAQGDPRARGGHAPGLPGGTPARAQRRAGGRTARAPARPCSPPAAGRPRRPRGRVAAAGRRA